MTVRSMGREQTPRKSCWPAWKPQTSLCNIGTIYECHTRPYGAPTHLGAARRPTLRRPHVIIAALSAAALALAACGGDDSGGSNASGGATKGGDLVLVRPSDS